MAPDEIRTAIAVVETKRKAARSAGASKVDIRVLLP
jgi:hypothetical protein